MIVDFHTHIFPQRVKDNRQPYLTKDPGFAGLYSTGGSRIATVDDLLLSMDEASVDVSVALNFAWLSHDQCVETNDNIIDAAGLHRDRLMGFCSIQPLAGDKALKELERCHHNGIKGIGEIRLDEQGYDIAGGEVVRPFLDLAEALGMILLIHASEPVGHEYPGKGSANLTRLYSVIEAYPNLKVVLAHWGGGMPFYSLMPEVSKVLKNTFFDTAATQLLYNDEIFRSVGQIIGPGKILFASDFPLITQARSVDLVRSLAMPEEDRRLILGGNAEGLLGLLSPDTARNANSKYEGFHSN